MLEKKIKHLEKRLEREEERAQESIEEGEVRPEPSKHSKKRKRDECKKIKTKKEEERSKEEVSVDIEHLEKTAGKNLPQFLREFFDMIDTIEISVQKNILKRVSPLLNNVVKYVILHDTILFSHVLERYEAFYKVLYPSGIEKDDSEVSQALFCIYENLCKEKDEEKIKSKPMKLLNKSADLSVIVLNEINQNAFDAATAIRLYSKVLDWDWTYNEFIRTHLYSELKNTNNAFAVLVLAFLYAEWHRFLLSHKSLEYVIQALDKIAGIGSGEKIVDSTYSLEAQIVSALLLRQFRPGAALKWQRQRMEEASPKNKQLIERAWKIVLF